MKKIWLKIFLLIAGLFAVLAVTLCTFYLIVTADAYLDKNKLINLNSSVEIYDVNGDLIDELSDDGKSVTDAEDIPDYTLNAFVAIEDKRFYSHHGVDVKGFFRAAFNNLRSFSFKEGASTISQQLIKNTHLSGEKTLKRKLAEIKLARQLENNYSKKEILEKYVNTIYFGDGCYGITSAAKHYFNVAPKDLTVNQSAALAGIIKAPAIYSPTASPENCNARKNTVLKEMFTQKYISESDYIKYKNEKVITVNSEKKSVSPYLGLVERELDKILDLKAYSHVKYKIYTYYDPSMQRHTEVAADSYDANTDKRLIVLNNENKITAFYSTCKDIQRQLGSTIKPIAVFAPAIDMGAIDSCTPIKDEKINIDGYAPSNYNDVYLGFVSAKCALSKSLNSCAVKLLNECGVEKCLSYIKKTDIPIDDSDASLSLALGATLNGATLTQISAAYGTFLNKGQYLSPRTIKKICTETGKTVYKDETYSKKVFGEDTAFIINDMLKNTVKEGTAKSLSSLNIPIAAKTGTVGTEKGNTDAYSVTYNGDYIIASWLGNADNSLMSNSISGGTVPTKMCYSVWQNIIKSGYSAKDLFTTDKVSRINIDKISYEENHTVESADENFPERYVLSEYFKKDRIPKTVSTRFSAPKIENAEISVNNNEISIKLCLKDCYDYKIYREQNGLKLQVYDSNGKNDKNVFTDKNLKNNTVYIYSVIPYFTGRNSIVYGEEYFLKEIKTSADFSADDWWSDLISEIMELPN